MLYNALSTHLPTPVVALHRAIAYGQVAGPRAALTELDALAGPLGSYHLFYATRAHLLRAVGHGEQARLADEHALRLTGNPAERALLEQLLA